jgi:nucleoside-diphosphate-sugar epimerase
MRITIFGGCGYLGSVMTSTMVARGHDVVVVDTLIYGDEPRRGWPAQARLITDDFRDESVVRAAVDCADAVIHLGGFVGEPACDLDERLTLEVNLAAPMLAAEAARQAGVRRFVFASTCSVYGVATDWLDETSPVSPISRYAYTKVEVEEQLRRLAGPDFGVLCLRMGTAYGLSGRARFDSVVNLMTARAVVTSQIPVRGGQQWRPFVHVRDIAEAFHLGLTADLPPFEVLNIGSDEQNHNIRDLAEIVLAATGEGRLDYQAGPEDGRNYRVRFGKAARTLGFAAEVDIASGVREMAAAIRSGDVSDPFAIRYNNYHGLRLAIEDGRVTAGGHAALGAHIPHTLPEFERFGAAAVRREVVV